MHKTITTKQKNTDDCAVNETGEKKMDGIKVVDLDLDHVKDLNFKTNMYYFQQRNN